ncbi:MAG: hypothetical protein Q7K34_00645 [archaeon]|nr:hypothetical protein [archaeon]
MRHHSVVNALERIALALFSIGVFVYIIISLKLWAADYSLWFFRIGDLQGFVLLSVGVFIAAKILEKLLKWEINKVLPHKRRPKK